MSAAPASPGRVRASDRDRARATSLLSEHYAQGRLNDAELDERTSHALTAVYTDELTGLFTDLPGAPVALPVVQPSRTRSVAASRVAQRRPWLPMMIVAAVAMVVLTRGAALWVLLALWWFAGPALRRRRGTDCRQQPRHWASTPAGHH
jgi:hypothetical protein